MSTIGRRRFIGLGVAGVLAAAAGLTLRSILGEPATAERVLRALGLAPSRSGLGDLGLRSLPGEADATAVERALVDDLGFRSRFKNDVELRHALLALVTRDCREGRIVKLGGWTLSRTEVRIAALQRSLWTSTRPAGSGRYGRPEPSATP